MSQDIQNAADLVNSLLESKGITTAPLQFHTLINEINDYDNDKQIINTIYTLLQDLDKSKAQNIELKRQLDGKYTESRAIQSENEELIGKYDQLIQKSQIDANKIDLLLQEIKNLKVEKTRFERLYHGERHLNNSLKTKYEIDIKRKNHTINSIRDNLLKKSRLEVQIPDAASDLIDDELEKMMVNLQGLINNLSVQNSQMLKFIKYVHHALGVTFESLQNGETLELDDYNYEGGSGNDNANDDMNLKLSNLAKFEKVQNEVIQSLQRFKNVKLGNRNDALEKEINKLRNDLEKALELNEKWKKKWDKK